MSVNIEGVEGCRAGKALGWDSLDDVTVDDVRLEGGDVGFVTIATDVGCVFLVGLYRGLTGKRDFGGLEGGDCGDKGGAGCVVGCRESCLGDMRGYREVCDNLELFIKVVEGNDGVEEHEQGFGNLEDILHWSRRLGFEVTDTIVSNVADCSSSEGWEVEAWNIGFVILG